MTESGLDEIGELNFSTIFYKACEQTPYPYQCRLACGDNALLDRPQTLTQGSECRSSLVSIPTGLGKTAAVTLAWLWNRVIHPDATHRAAWPRRLVYCLPMRTLVEQTRDVMSRWLSKLQLEDQVRVSVLMGGEEADDWDLWPEREAIIIGTQDMLLSRALNRGYGMSRYRWPMHFALLNNDSLWVFDEIQLMGSGLATTAQLEAFRELTGGFATNVPVRSIWMSATLDRQWLQTVDFNPGAIDRLVKLESEDREGNDNVSRRCGAKKVLRQAESSSQSHKTLAAEIVKHHHAGTLTLVILNTVQRARLLYAELLNHKLDADLLLIHSRFRPGDRQKKIKTLVESPPNSGRIVVSTQVIEAGVDISARTLFTELAPWTSLVQRFGRCNRSGEFLGHNTGHVFWIDLASDDKSARPYTPIELDLARTQLQSLAELSVGPDALTKLNIKVTVQHRHVIRRKDMIELFDTTPDLAGNDIDIDRYVRDTDDSDVRVFWRDLHATAPSPDEPVPVREELCPTPIGGPAGFRQFEDKLGKAKHLHLRSAYRRNYLRRTWEPVAEGDIFPGQIYLLDRSWGGYDSETGWTGEVAKKNAAPVAAVSLRDSALETDDSNDADPSSHIAVWQTIAEHTQDVCRELDTILHALQPPQAGALRVAARWHDWGKAHRVFQAAVRDRHPKLGTRPIRWIDNREIAKAPGKRDLKEGFASSWWRPYGRPRFRHELVSALAIVQLNVGYIGEDVRDLVAYLVAAHHGKIRLSIRSLPGEIQPGNGKRFARGVWDGDALPDLDLGGGVSAPAMVLSLQPMEIGHTSEGRPSWTEIALRLRDTFGPFRLAYLEALLRAADMRASQFAEMVAASSMRAEEVCHT